MTTDPYAAPKARVEDIQRPGEEGIFIPYGQRVAAGNGWRWIAGGWRLFTRQPGMWILIEFVFAAMVLAVNVVPVLGTVAFSLLSPVFFGGFLLGCRDLARDGELGLAHLFAGFRHQFGKLLLLGLFNIVASFAAMAIAALVASLAGLEVLAGLGMVTGLEPAGEVPPIALLVFVLLMLAFLLPVAVAVWFAPALVLFNDYGVAGALRTSFVACLKNLVPFLLYALILFGFAIVASLPLLLGWLVLGPIIMASLYASYRDIFYAR